MSEQPNLFDDVPEPHGAYRRAGPETSKEAGLAMRGDRLTEIQEDVLAFFRYNGPSTDEELEDSLAGKHPGFSTLRKRRSELAQAKRLCDTGQRKMNRNGRRMIVWGIPERQPA
jgi:hypothetical protein